MKHEVIHLCRDDENVTLTTYVQTSKDQKSDALLVIPGGGYSNVCSDREGENIALVFNGMGMQCFVLNYSTKEKAKYPRPLQEASLAMAYIKSHAEEYGIDPERVFVLGFSAGGHLAGSLGTLWHKPEAYKPVGLEFGANRPCGMILCYPVLSYFPETHLGTFYNALGTRNPSEEEASVVSLEKHVDENTVPSFLWHTADDASVHVDNTLKMMSALARNKIYCEAHVYPHGPHGMALATPTTDAKEGEMTNERIAEWPRLAKAWMKTVK